MWQNPGEQRGFAARDSQSIRDFDARVKAWKGLSQVKVPIDLEAAERMSLQRDLFLETRRSPSGKPGFEEKTHGRDTENPSSPGRPNRALDTGSFKGQSEDKTVGEAARAKSEHQIEIELVQAKDILDNKISVSQMM